METEAGSTSRNTVTTFDWSGAESVTAAVIDAVARASRAGPTDIAPLYDVIDPDALNALFETASRTASSGPVVEFEYHDMLVEVNASGDGRVVPYR